MAANGVFYIGSHKFWMSFSKGLMVCKIITLIFYHALRVVRVVGQLCQYCKIGNDIFRGTTHGSVLCSSSHNSVVGIKPTIGLTCRAGLMQMEGNVAELIRNVKGVYMFSGREKNDRFCGNWRSLRCA
ncbi:hypothetical protein C5167_043495 [Papaver somniferum]|uniref:Uncharacterized protein n=1 Tax=Papaver somniferum TaxID=3469 RepID=A0A4Y7L9C2_PAPSO|nr:hypothetical protein C5167_043495 [Papaver somniferum]